MTTWIDRAWNDARRAAVIAAYDTGAANYDADPYPSDMQQEWVQRLVATCPAGGTVLDAPCGTGRYFSIVADAGLQVVGIDQSAGMLEQARRRGIAIELEHVGLQELAYVAQFDAVMTVDAMENVAPEDWPLVLGNLHRAVQPGGHLYMTVEEENEVNIDTAYATLSATGAPAVHGEVVEGDVAGYHFYPGRQRVIESIDAAGLQVVDEGFKQEDGWGYRHLLLQRPTQPVVRD